MEVEDQSQLQLGCSQIRQHLREVLTIDGLDRLELHDHAPRDHEIESMLADQYVSVENLLDRLLREGNLSTGKLDNECALVNGLDEAWSQFSMNRDRSADQRVGKSIDLM